MKRHIITICIVCSALMSVACTRGFEDLNKDPNALNNPTPELLFNSSMRGTLNLYGGDINRVVTFNFTQMFVGFQGRFQRYSEDPQTLINYWKNAYTQSLMPANDIIDIYGGKEGYENRVQIAKIWKCYLLSQMTAIWGPIPYEYGLKADITTPYNREEDIYYMLFDDLKTAADAIDVEGDTYSNDLLFPVSIDNKVSDLVKWKKFANTLRLRLAMRISNAAPNGDPVKAKEIVEEVFANEEMTMNSDDDSAAGKWGGLISAEGGDYNPLYYYAVYEKSKNIGTLPAFGETACYHMQPYNDPRLPIYAQPVVSKKESDGTVPVHAGEYFGDTASYGGYGGESGLSYPAENVHSKMTREDYSALGARFLLPDAEFVFLSYAECCFLKAEAKLRGWGSASGKSAEAYYNDGIRGSMAHYDIDAAAVDAYLATPGIAWGTATKTTDDLGNDVSTQFMDWLQICNSIVGVNDFQHQIIMQHWLAIPCQGLDAWTLIRRTQELQFEPCFSGYEGFYKYLPYRLNYPTSEVQYNTTECAKAYTEYLSPRGSFSGNDMYVKLWWALPNRKIEAIPNETPYL